MSVGSFKTASASTEIFFKKKSSDVNDEANFSFFSSSSRVNPILPPFVLAHLRAR
jgi:hypothetical protein